MSAQPPIRLIAGPTASGKTALALDWARADRAVVVNADSQQLYADLRILTARPTPEEEAQAEHRLFGVADAAEAWSVGRWLRAVAEVVDEARAASRPLILVGGTGLYFRALTQGLADIPEVPETVRDAVGERFDREGETAFRRALSVVDPAAEAGIAPGDRQRLVRAMSVFEASGTPLTDWQGATRPLLAPDAWTGVVIEPYREALYARCDARFDAMVAGGVLDEVRALMERRLDPELPAMKATGLRELMAHLRGEASLDEAVEAAKRETRRYAKRQLTWFRNQTRDWRRHLSSG